MDQSNGYFTISDLAKELDVKKSHIRFSEESGLISPRSSKLKRRVYNRYDRERLKLAFHFVLLGYSKEDILDLIGIGDVNLDENDQLTQGIAYGSKALDKLEKRKEELSFTKQTRIINEIEMLREYLNKIKAIKSGVLDEPSTRPSIGFEEKANMLSKPVMAITAEAEEKTTQHHFRVILSFVAGLALVILIGSYLYYQAGQKQKISIQEVQKKPIHSGKIIELKTDDPLERAAKSQVATLEEQKISESNSPDLRESLDAQSTDTFLRITQGNGEVTSDSDTFLMKDEKHAEEQLDVNKTDTVLTNDAIQTDIAKETFQTQHSNEMATTSGEVLVAEKQKLSVPKVEEVIKDDVQKKVAGEDFPEKEALVGEDEETLAVIVPESGMEKVAETVAKPSLTDLKRRMDQIPSEENITQQKNELNRLKSFLDEYCQAYTNKDLDKLMTFYTSDATENNKPFHGPLPDHRKNMERMKSLSYRIELMSYSKQTHSENLMVRGKFFIRYQSQEGIWEENNGGIFMELIENGNSFLVKQLDYTD